MSKVMDKQYQARIDRLRQKLAEKRLSGVILAPGANLRYYTGGNSLLLERPFFMIIPIEGDPRLVTPTLEAGPYVKCPLKMMIHKWSDTEGPSEAIREAVAGLDWSGRWGVGASMPYGFLDALLKNVKAQFDNADSILQGIRSVKDPQEVRLLTRSADILSETFLEIPPMLRAGMSEIELSQQISHQINSNGAESAPDVLVQSGPMAADAHHLPSTRKLKRKESIVVDATCTFGGYFADITRTFILGKDNRFQKLYEILHDAQIAAVKAARTGVPVGSVDSAARTFLRERKLDNYFVHRTGHGLGLEVHEEPYIVQDGPELLTPSMAFTVEPGIYQRGKTGLRIEDDLITGRNTSVVLTKSVPKEYGWWN
ncbi:MAG TPA: Xaa-Pro peptidase family protein [Candidatus Dormibacteraeota bacterium]|nr:Xaa-Pro peptidase family protein [Candidatus Dormibacteraeota bacterium]